VAGRLVDEPVEVTLSKPPSPSNESAVQFPAFDVPHDRPRVKPQERSSLFERQEGLFQLHPRGGTAGGPQRAGSGWKERPFGVRVRIPQTMSVRAIALAWE